MIPPMRVIVGIWMLFALAISPLSAQSTSTQPTTKPLVFIQKGDYPILLSAPHGGQLEVPGAPIRTGEQFLSKRGLRANFANVRDVNVDLVAHEIAEQIEKLTGKRPYLVVANFHRRYCDVNRTPQEAYESEAGQTVYDEYHAAIAQFRKEIIEKWKRGLLIDLHGQGRPGQEDKIIRGTADWASVRHLVEEFGKTALLGKDGLLGSMESSGLHFTPRCDEPTATEYPTLNGGFITRNYGSFQGGSFDSIQFEIGSDLRQRVEIPEHSKKIAKGIVTFTKNYLLNPAQPEPATHPTTQEVER